MEFKLSTSGMFYSDADKVRYEKLGFSFKQDEGNKPFFKEAPWFMTEGGAIPKIDINTIEGLLAFVEEWGSVIVSPDGIEIYNDYRE